MLEEEEQNKMIGGEEFKDKEKKASVEKYVEQMDSLQKKAYLIASGHLKSSFNIIHSNGYKEYLKKNADK